MNSPPVANAAALAVLNAATGVRENNPDARTLAGRAAKRAKSAIILNGTGLVTTPEVGDQVIHATATAIAGIPGGLPNGAPAWAQALNVNLNARFDAVNANLNARFDAMNARLDNIEARLANSTATEPEDPLRPLTNAAGLPSPNFPDTLSNLYGMNNQALGALLAHYQHPLGQVNTRARRVRRFLGVRV